MTDGDDNSQAQGTVMMLLSLSIIFLPLLELWWSYAALIPEMKQKLLRENRGEELAVLGREVEEKEVARSQAGARLPPPPPQPPLLTLLPPPPQPQPAAQELDTTDAALQSAGQDPFAAPTSGEDPEQLLPSPALPGLARLRDAHMLMHRTSYEAATPTDRMQGPATPVTQLSPQAVGCRPLPSVVAGYRPMPSATAKRAKAALHAQQRGEHARYHALLLQQGSGLGGRNTDRAQRDYVPEDTGGRPPLGMVRGQPHADSRQWC